MCLPVPSFPLGVRATRTTLRSPWSQSNKEDHLLGASQMQYERSIFFFFLLRGKFIVSGDGVLIYDFPLNCS